MDQAESALVADGPGCGVCALAGVIMMNCKSTTTVISTWTWEVGGRILFCAANKRFDRAPREHAKVAATLQLLCVLETSTAKPQPRPGTYSPLKEKSKPRQVRKFSGNMMCQAGGAR